MRNRESPFLGTSSYAARARSHDVDSSIWWIPSDEVT